MIIGRRNTRVVDKGKAGNFYCTRVHFLIQYVLMLSLSEL